mgnify:CR=1 FL=1
MTSKILIVYLGNFYFDARCINMALSLIKKNYKVSVISTHKNKYNLKIFNKVVFYSVKLKKRGFLKYINFYHQVNNILKKNPFDTIICGDLYSLASATKYNKKSQIIFDSREIYSELFAHKNKPWLRLFCSIYENYFLKHVKQVIVTAHTDKKYLQKKYQHHKHLSWKIIYNYPKFFPLNSKIIKKKKINILYQGVIQKGRGIKKLINLIKFTDNYTATIIGNGDIRQKYIRLVEQLNIQNKVTFIDAIPYLKLHEYTIRGDVGWALIDSSNLSNSYALPNKIFEYALMGLPVISSNIQNIEVLFNKYQIGKIIYTESNNVLEEEIDTLSSNKKDPLFYHNIIKKHFCWKVQENTFIKIIKGQ